jgi:hypothetical protein
VCRTVFGPERESKKEHNGETSQVLYFDDQIKDEMGWACSRHKRYGKERTISGKLEGKILFQTARCRGDNNIKMYPLEMCGDRSLTSCEDSDLLECDVESLRTWFLMFL